MIRYTLHCANAHSFDSWFKSAASFEDLSQAGHISCPQCGSTDVRKSLMAPPVTTSRNKRAAEQNSDTEQTLAAPPSATPQTPPTSQADQSPSSPTNAAPTQPSQADIETSIAKMRNHVETTSEYVGENFTKEARAMNDGDSPSRPIYGEAKLEDAKALIEEGVPVIPLPFAPKRKLN
jgi:hypothetical protein